MTQQHRLESAWRKGAVITPLDALKRFGTMRLAARVYDARQNGLDVRRKLVQRGKKVVAAYFLA